MISRRVQAAVVVLLPVILAVERVAADTFDYHGVRGRRPTAPASGVHEGEALPRSAGARTQGMEHYGPQWSGGAHLLWQGKIGEACETTFRVERAGRYRVSIRLTRAPDYGVFSVGLNGKKLASGVDLYAPRVELADALDLGEQHLDAGEQELVLRLEGANAKAVKFRGEHYLLGVDVLKLTPLDPVPYADASSGPAEPEVHRSFAELRPLLSTYCHRCHGGERVKGKVDLVSIESEADLLSNIELARKVARALSDADMPPEDEQQPTPAERAELAALFNTTIDRYLATAGALVPTAMRRMSRYEYSNAVRDLLDLRGPIYALPEAPIRAGAAYFDPASGRFPDTVRVGNRALGKNQIEQRILTGVVPFAIDLQAEHGFNNRGEELSLSPILLESLLRLGRSIVDSPEFDGYTGMRDSLFRASADLDVEARKKLARERLAGLLERAFRQPVDTQTLDRYAGYVARELDRGESFEASMKGVVAAVLASPRFVYMVEGTVAGDEDSSGDERVTPYELATRLSFFLWSSIPDDELLALARSGELRRREVVEAQVRRMLEDPRCQSLSQNFARQWLRLDQLITAVPDFERFERYYARIGCEQWKLGLQSMVEPLLLFESILVEDRSIMLLVDSNYSYRSDELQSWYHDEVPFGNRGNRNRFNTFMQDFRRRSLETRREGGVLTTAATLTMTSSPLRTSPIIRGAWVATVILNRPPPPPPDVVPEIEADDAEIEARGLTVRQRLVEHQENEACASCHSKIDPLGHALENFDAVGRWRDRYRSGLPIDASGELFGKARFRDVIELKDALLENPEWFQRAFTEHMLSYALGRELEVADGPAVDLILRRLLADRGKLSTLVLGIATSYPFLHKTRQPERHNEPEHSKR